MKFEEQINKIRETLEEEIAPQQAGQPQASNPTQVAPQAQQQPQQQQQQPQQPQQQGDPADQLFNMVGQQWSQKNPGKQPNAADLLQFALDADPNEVKTWGTNNQQNMAAQPAATNTSGQQGATTTQV